MVRSICHAPASLVELDRRAVGKILSAIAEASVDEILAGMPESDARSAHVIGITGAPGAGKSTLIGKLALRRLMKARSLAILAIDPTSPHSDGSLLGDRIRMAELSEDPRVFIRSLPSRSAEDGLTENTVEIVAALDRCAFDEVLIETVGAGQTGVGIRMVADVEVLVLTPGAGDYVQAMKAGIMETADIYVVNKSDLPGAERTAGEILGVLEAGRNGRVPPIIRVCCTDGSGIAELSTALDESLLQSINSDNKQSAQQLRRQFRIRKLIQRRVNEVVRMLPDHVWSEPIAECYRKVMNTLTATAESETGE